MTESIYEFVMAELRRNYGHLPRIARETGIPLSRLHRIKSRETKDPPVSVVEQLTKYFREDLERRLNGTASRPMVQGDTSPPESHR